MKFADNLEGVLSAFARENNFVWTFNPPHASHFGGVWERQIRSIRNVLDAILTTTNVTLTHEILTKFLSEAAAIVNSRPISGNPDDIDAPPLTPSTLLTLKKRPISSPLTHIVKEDQFAKKWWRRAQHMANEFWSRWRSEYLQNFQPRSKWLKITRNLQEGDIVLLKEDTLAKTRRNYWPMARVVNAKKSSDGLIRSVTLNSTHFKGLVERPVSKLVLLVPNYDSSNVEEEASSSGEVSQDCSPSVPFLQSTAQM